MQWAYHPDGRAMIVEGDIPEGWLSTPPFDLPAEEWTERARTGASGIPGGSALVDADDDPAPAGEAPKRRGRPPKVVEAP